MICSFSLSVDDHIAGLYSFTIYTVYNLHIYVPIAGKFGWELNSVVWRIKGKTTKYNLPILRHANTKYMLFAKLKDLVC